jgi:glycerophosphoryl diester phosphodiesterase
MNKQNPWLALTLALSACDPAAEAAPSESFVLSQVLASDRVAANKLTATKPQFQFPPRLAARAVLPAHTFAPGPTSGQRIAAANGVAVPFVDKQPVQGFSAILRDGPDRFLAMADNGFGAIDNSADFHLRVYRIQPKFESLLGGAGTVSVLGFIELADPDGHIEFPITNQFSPGRVLTGADFDLESMQKAPDGTLWFGDEFGPFLLHTSADGRLLEAPIPLPDFASPGQEIRSPQNPFSEEGMAIRLMNAVAGHARAHGATRSPVFSPWYVMLADNDPATFVDNRQAPPAGSGLAAASSEIFDVAGLKTAGYPVVPYTVNNLAQMKKLITLGVNGLISDRPDLLFQAVAEHDANGDGVAGDWLDADGLVRADKFDVQGHRGGRDLRQENTLPAMEVALDHLMTTLELDVGLSRDYVPVLDHDPLVQAEKCRRKNGAAYSPEQEVLVKDLYAFQLQSQFVCDKLFRGPQQLNDPALSPVSVAFQSSHPTLGHIYAPPTLPQVFAFVSDYADYYHFGAGVGHPEATKRWKNAERVRFNIETKLNPRAEFAARTYSPEDFAAVVGSTILEAGLAERADVQSFDFRSLLLVQEWFPEVRTVYLFGDFPLFADPTLPGSDDSTNLQDENGQNTPWLAGLRWPYRATKVSNPIRAARSGGFEGMALSADGKTLFPLLELPLAGDDGKLLRIHAFDLATRMYTGLRATYRLAARGTNIGDFFMIDGQRGLVIERDGSQGDLTGEKKIYEIRLGAAGAEVDKTLLVDLQNIWDPFQISLPAGAGDVGLGSTFSFPFQTIEDVVLLGGPYIGVVNDNNFPFSVGRHVGSAQPDDNELIVIDVGRWL